MAGGMYRGRAGPSLFERAASSGVQTAQERSAEESREREPMGSASAEPPVGRPFSAPGRATAPAREQASSTSRHCWVRDPPDVPGVWPGLLVEWRQREDGWHGRVAYAVPGPGGAVLVEAWLPAEQLKQG